MLKSSPSRYGTVAVTIHWLTAALILIALGAGFRASHSINAVAELSWLRIHLAAATAILVLTLGRIGWWIFLDRKPHAINEFTAKWLARPVHLLFYVAILGLGASGIGMIILSGKASAIFEGTITQLPNFQLYPPHIPHGLVARILLVLLVAHVGAALYHHFICRDGLLRRMWYS